MKTEKAQEKEYGFKMKVTVYLTSKRTMLDTTPYNGSAPTVRAINEDEAREKIGMKYSTRFENMANETKGLLFDIQDIDLVPSDIEEQKAVVNKFHQSGRDDYSGIDQQTTLEAAEKYHALLQLGFSKQDAYKFTHHAEADDQTEFIQALDDYQNSRVLFKALYTKEFNEKGSYNLCKDLFDEETGKSVIDNHFSILQMSWATQTRTKKAIAVNGRSFNLASVDEGNMYFGEYGTSYYYVTEEVNERASSLQNTELSQWQEGMVLDIKNFRKEAYDNIR